MGPINAESRRVQPATIVSTGKGFDKNQYVSGGEPNVTFAGKKIRQRVADDPHTIATRAERMRLFVDSAPPLSAAQRDRVAILLGGGAHA